MMLLRPNELKKGDKVNGHTDGWLTVAKVETNAGKVVVWFVGHTEPHEYWDYMWCEKFDVVRYL